MNYARRLACRAASRKGRAAIKDQTRRGFFAERLEDRSLMAADILSNFHNYSSPKDVNSDSQITASDVLTIINSINSLGVRQLPQSGAEGESGTGYVDVDADGYVSPNDVLSVINYLNAEGEAGSTLPQKARYVLQILDSNGVAQTTASFDSVTGELLGTSNRTATIRAGSDFYVQLVAQDVRPDGTDPTNGNDLARGVFTAYTDVLFNTNFATLAANETQLVRLNSGVTGTFTLTLPAAGNTSGISGTTAPITIVAGDGPATAKNIQAALNTAFFGGRVGGTSVQFISATSRYQVTFLGINNISLPLLTSTSATVTEVTDGASTNALAAFQAEVTNQGVVNYPNGPSNEYLPGYGLNDVGAFAGLTPLGGSALPVFRVHLIATLPSGSTGSVVFTPDPLGDGSGTQPNDMVRGGHNTLVYGNLNVPTETEESLVIFSETNNEFRNLVPVTLSINTGPYTAVPDPANVNENLAGGTNSVSIPVLNNDSITGTIAGIPNPVKEIKSFDATTTGGTITKSGDNLIFTPNANFNGTATFTYVGGIATDTDTNDTAVGTVTVTVAAVNSPPSVTGPNAITATDENAAVTFSGANAITVTDVDVTEGAGSHLLAMTLNTSAGTTLTLGSTTGLTNVAGNGSTSVTFTGTPADITAALASLSVQNTTERGVTASVTVKADDQGQTGAATAGGTSFTKTISITFPDVNDAPVNLIGGSNADGQHVVTIPNSTNTPMAGFSVNDVDVGAGTLTVTLTAGEGTLSGTGFTNSGTASVTITGTQAAVNAALATLAYTPKSGSTTATTLLFVTSDNGNTGTGGTKTTTSNVVIDLDPGFRPAPIADSTTINEGTTGPVTIDVLANDFKSGGSTVTAITGVTQPAQGTVNFTAASVTFTPPADTNFFTPSGPLTFTYTIDETPASATPPTVAQRTATVSVNIKNVADAPVANGSDGPYAAVFDSAAATQTPLVVLAADGVLKNDTDVDNNYGVNNYATLKAVINATTTRGTLALAADGSFTYTPGPGTTDDSFTYHVNAVTPESGAAGIDSNVVTVNIHITGRPTATNDHFNVLEQGNPASSGNVLTGQGSSPASAADVDASDGKTLTAVNLVQLQNPATVGTVVLNTDGSFSYTPPAGQNFNTTRPAAPDITFTYQAKTSDGRLSLPATVSLTVQEVNDPPTAVADTFLAVKKNVAGTIGVNQEIFVASNDSTDPDNGDESVSVVGISLTNGSFGTAEITTAAGGKVRLVGGKIFYDSPQTVGPDSFFYQISDNSSAARSGPLFASAKVSIDVVDFVPKTISGTVYIDANGDGLKATTEKALGGITVRLTGTDFTNQPVSLTAVTDSSGNYKFPSDATFLLKPPLPGTSYTVTEDPVAYLFNGLDTDLSTNIDTNTNAASGHTGKVVTNSNRLDSAFLLSWSITDTSGNVTGLNFGEGSINTSPTDPDGNGPAGTGLSDASGIKGELLASSGRNGFIVASELSTGRTMWNWSIEGDTGAWGGASLVSAVLSNDLTSLLVTVQKGGTSYTATLTQGYSIPGSSARFRILGVGQNGQYIIRIDASFNGTTIDPRTGLYDGMFVSNSATLQGAEGEAPAYRDFTNSADAVFSEQAWA